MYAREIKNGTRYRRFSISRGDGSGWLVREERDDQAVHEDQYDDWHRVERAQRQFSMVADELTGTGWTEA